MSLKSGLSDWKAPLRGPEVALVWLVLVCVGSALEGGGNVSEYLRGERVRRVSGRLGGDRCGRVMGRLGESARGRWSGR